MKNTLLFGNGINRLTKKSISWNDLLEKIKGKNKFENGALPYTMIYERILLERPVKQINETEFLIKKEISKELEKQKTNLFYNKIIDLGFENYLTTNYDYAFEKTIQESYFKGKVSMLTQNKSEKIYSIRRFSKFTTNGLDAKLWQIHGEISNPKSIMIGLDHYGGSISKIDDYIKGNYKLTKNEKQVTVKSIKEKIESNDYDDISWIELMFNSNVHIVGLGLDYSEIDLWWLINKRARLNKEIHLKNEIILYTDKLKKEERDLFKALNIIVIEIEVKDNNFEEQYEVIIQKIKNYR